MTCSGEYGRLHPGFIDDIPYGSLPPRSRLVLFGALMTITAPFPGIIDRDRLASHCGLPVDAVERALGPVVAAGLLIPVGERFNVGTFNGQPIVLVPSQFHARARRIRRRIPRRVRELVIQRDGYRCRRCGATALLQFDHVEPWALGGSDEPENLQLLCGPCNRRKGPNAFITRRSPSEVRT